MQTLEQIEEQMLIGGQSPGTLADFRVTLSALFSRASGELEEILASKPYIWRLIRNRDSITSDKAATMEWDSTDEGIREMRLRSKMKRIESLTRAISSLLRVKELEAKNQF